MTLYNTFNVKLFNLQLHKLKSGIKNGIDSFIKFDWKFNDETTFPHKLLSTDNQVSRIYKPFANGSSANTKVSKTQLSKMIQ